jgi:hypothetical protein
MFFRTPDVTALAPVVVMSRGHSGTRVLAFLMDRLGVAMGTSEELATGDVEDLDFSGRVKKIARDGLGVRRSADVPPRLRRAMARAVARYHARLGRPQGPWGWKFPETYLVGPCLFATVPRVRMVHMVRDGRDVAFKQHLTDDPERALGHALLARVGALGRPRDEQAALSWAYQVDAFDAFKDELGRGALHELTFEDLCRQPERELERLAAFLGIEVTAAALEHARTRIRPDKVAQFREQSDADVARVTAAIAPTLARWGYGSPSAAAGASSPASTRS